MAETRRQYTHETLPPVRPHTGGYMLPKPDGTVAACMAPTEINWPYPANWGKPEGATMAVPAGGWITCLGPGDSYYNDELLFTSALTGVVLNPDDDPRAAELAKPWLDRGLHVLVVEVQKIVGAIVLGEVADEAIGQELLTAEGPQTLQSGDVIVLSPRRPDRVYRITPENRAKRYVNGGQVFPGELPAEFR